MGGLMAAAAGGTLLHDPSGHKLGRIRFLCGAGAFIYNVYVCGRVSVSCA
jgi:hypothetical protein